MSTTPNEVSQSVLNGYAFEGVGQQPSSIRPQADELTSSSLFGPSPSDVGDHTPPRRDGPPSPSTPFLFGARPHLARAGQAGAGSGFGTGGAELVGASVGRGRPSPADLGKLRGRSRPLPTLQSPFQIDPSSYAYSNESLRRTQPASEEPPPFTPPIEFPSFPTPSQASHSHFAHNAPNQPTTAPSYPFNQPQSSGFVSLAANTGVKPSLTSSMSADALGVGYIGHHLIHQNSFASPSAATPMAATFNQNATYAHHLSMRTPTTDAFPRFPPPAPFLPNDFTDPFAQPPSWPGGVYDTSSSPTSRYRTLSNESLVSSASSSSPFFSPSSISSSVLGSPYSPRPPLPGPSSSFPPEYHRPRATTIGFMPEPMSAPSAGRSHQHAYSADIRRPQMLSSMARQLSYQGSRAAPAKSASTSHLAPMLTAHKAGASSRPSTSSSRMASTPPPIQPEVGSPYSFTSPFALPDSNSFAANSVTMSPRSALLPQLGALGLQSPQGSALAPLPGSFGPSSESPTSPMSPPAFESSTAWPGVLMGTEFGADREAMVKDEEESESGIVGAADGWGEQAWGGDEEEREPSVDDGDQRISPITGRPT